MNRIKNNPFYLLGLPPTASRTEIERQGQKLLGLLEIGAKQASTYMTPFGAFSRDADQIRQALSELRNPERRLMHEIWATLPAEKIQEYPKPFSPPPWENALKILRWKP